MAVSELRETREREVKLSPGAHFAMPDLGGEALAPRVFVSTYHDTPDHLLARAGITLRRRVERGRGVWQLKLPSGDARLELEEDGAARTVPPRIAELLLAFLRRGELRPVARLKTRRDGVRVDGAEVVHDSVSVLHGQRVERTFDELEVELIDGDERALKRLEKRLRRAGAADGERRPKLFRALDLAYDSDPGEAPRDSTAAAALATAFRTQHARMLAHDPGTRLGADPESLHQLRVATRRLRAFLRAARPLLDPEWADELRAELGWLGSALGAARDLDVLADHLGREAARLDGPDVAGANVVLREVAKERRATRRRVVRALRSDRYLTLLDRLEEAGDPPLASAAAYAPSLTDVWRGEHAKLHRAVRSLGAEPADDALHEVRIKVKRARYAAELARLDGYVRAAKSLQDVLGEHQDAVVAEARLRAVAETHPEAALAAGRLVERERARRARTRETWREHVRALAKQAKKA
jgi:CHAD domain-containing protein